MEGEDNGSMIDHRVNVNAFVEVRDEVSEASEHTSTWKCSMDLCW